MSKLTDKQEMFCKEYLIDLNATQAAIRAGYSEKTAAVIGNENLTKPYLADYIHNLKAKRSEKLTIDADWVLMSAKRVFDRCMQDEQVIDKDGATGEYKFEHAGANKALDTIGKHIDVQAFNEKSTVETNVTVKDFSEMYGEP